MELTDIRLRSVMHFDPIKRTFGQSRNLKYFRRPSSSEYPLDLRRGYDAYVHRNELFPGAFDQVQQFLMQADQLKQMLQETDFILNRCTLILFMSANLKDINEYRFEAFRFKGCIFIKHLNDTEQEPNIRNSYAFKARQCLLTERHGEDPDTDTPIDERMQQYGIFSARVGQFRLLYSGELTGLSNTEPLGDLTNQKELDKCRLINIRVNKADFPWRNNYRCVKWVSQAYLSGADQIVVASFDDQGKVVRPIEVESVETLKQRRRLDIGGGVQLIHQFLERISRKLQDLDSSAVIVRCKLIGQSLVFEEALSTEFMDYVNQL